MKADANRTRWRWMARHSEMASCNHLFDVGPDELEAIIRAIERVTTTRAVPSEPDSSDLPKAIRTLCGMPPVDAGIATESPDLHYCRKCAKVATQRKDVQYPGQADAGPAGRITFNNNPG